MKPYVWLNLKGAQRQVEYPEGQSREEWRRETRNILDLTQKIHKKAESLRRERRRRVKLFGREVHLKEIGLGVTAKRRRQHSLRYTPR